MLSDEPGEGELDEAGSAGRGGRDRIARLRALLDKVEHYQPLYGLEDLVPTPARETADRCAAIDAAVGPVAGRRVLDIGSSLGYVSHYLADRGAHCTGWDARLENVEVAALVGDVIGSSANFRLRSASNETVGALPDDAFDVALVLSVLHHVIRFDGLAAAQSMMALLVRRVPLVIVELAGRGEDVNLPWDSHLPEDPLEVLASVGSDVEITQIGDFATHLSKQARPMYLLRRPQVVTVGGRMYQYDDSWGQAYEGSPVARARRLRRRYFIHPDHIIKRYDVLGDPIHDREQVVNEIAVLLDLTRRAHVARIPPIVDFEIGADVATIVTRRVPGSPLGLPGTVPLSQEEAVRLAVDLLGVLRDLADHGYFHNDLRSWNVLWGDEGAWLIDFGLTSPLEREDQAIALLWVLHAALTGQREDYSQHKSTLPPRDPFGIRLQVVYDLVAAGESVAEQLLAALI